MSDLLYEIGCPTAGGVLKRFRLFLPHCCQDIAVLWQIFLCGLADLLGGDSAQVVDKLIPILVADAKIFIERHIIGLIDARKVAGEDTSPKAVGGISPLLIGNSIGADFGDFGLNAG